VLNRSVLPRRALLAGAAATAMLALSACGGDDSSSGSGMNHEGMAPMTSASAGSATFNDADVMFAQMMIPHHREAVEMAEMAATRASDAEVKSLASKIQEAQQPEIDTMTAWLSAWGQPTPMPSMSDGMSMPGALPSMNHGSMPGAMSPADMAKLEAAKGPEFDKQFVTMMIAHHQGAITMAQEEVQKGSNPEAKALAQKIITDQQSEITTMQGILARL
jgi:uncharacterized protein (DUF305 family)